MEIKAAAHPQPWPRQQQALRREVWFAVQRTLRLDLGPRQWIGTHALVEFSPSWFARDEI